MTSLKKKDHSDLPLSRFQFFRTADLDEARSVISTHYHPMKLTTLGKHCKFQATYNHLFLDDISLTAFHNIGRLCVESESTEDAYILQFLPLQGVGSAKNKNEEINVDKHYGALFSPFSSCENDYSENHSQIVIRIERVAVESAFKILCGKSLLQPLEFKFEIDLKNPKLSSLQNYVQFIVGELDQEESFIRIPEVQAHLREALIFGLLSTQPHNAASLLDRPCANSGMRYAKRAEDYICNNLTEEISVSQVAENIGINIRSLQIGFKQLNGCTMRDFIKTRRLNLARNNLLHADGRNIAEIALMCGFNHLSQFSADYQKKFGEKPSQTLARSQKKFF